MEKEIDYKALYILQDMVLEIIFSLSNNFYLTGGTALHRFHYNARYSDDLDFFTYCDDLFGESVIEVFDVLSEEFEVKHTVKSKEFHRIIVNDLLQLDFVNDRVHREGKSLIIRGIRVDNKVDILTNKICAILGRDEAKDFFDLFCLAEFEEFNWNEVLEIANKKCKIEKELFIQRINSFPLSWLKNIKFIKYFEINESMKKQLCDDVFLEKNNSLVRRS